MHHIRASLPDIKSRISANQQKFTAELLSLGGPLGDGNSGNIVLSVITEFTSEFRTTIDGNTNDLSLNELSGGARISFVFHELFNNGVKSIDPFDQVKDGDIRTILYNSSVRPNEHPKFLFFHIYHPLSQGSTPALFVGTAAFEVIVKQQIKRLEDPSLKCCQLVYDELIRILGQLLTKVVCLFMLFDASNTRSLLGLFIASFPTVSGSTGPIQCCRGQLLQAINESNDEAGAGYGCVRVLYFTLIVYYLFPSFSMQACYVNTTHPDFIGGHKVS